MARLRETSAVDYTALNGQEAPTSEELLKDYVDSIKHGGIENAIRDEFAAGMQAANEKYYADLKKREAEANKRRAQLQLQNFESVEQYKQIQENDSNKRLAKLDLERTKAVAKGASDYDLKKIDAKIEAEKKAREKMEKDLADEQSDLYQKIDADAQKNRQKNDEIIAKEKQKAELKRIKEQTDEYAKQIKEKGVFATLKAVGGLKGLRDEIAKNEDGEITTESQKKANKTIAATALVDGINKLTNYADSLRNSIDQIAEGKTVVDTALQGSRHSRFLGSYYDQMVQTATRNIGVSPLVKQEDYMKNINTAVSKGIAFNVEQRAFLATISNRIADTFDVFDSNLAKLIRVQQEDTTAGRLGMESALTSFMNNMYETSEYMKDAFSEVTSNLTEASSLMTGKAATEFEYQVQKWLGSLYSVGISKSAVGNISQALGQVAAGKVEGITGGGAGNLVVMAANQAGLSIADVLKDGLNSDETNRLLNAMVNYLSGIYDSSKDSHVVQQQMASVFGLTASDLKAVANLAKEDTIKNIAETNMSYSGMIGQLNKMANTMYSRTSIGSMVSNLTDNFKYSMASGIANNPITYLTYNMANMLQDLTGGIKLPDIKVLGTGVNLNTTVANLMKVASMSGGILNGIIGLATGLTRGAVGSGLLSAFGIGGGTPTTVTRGTPGIASSISSGEKSSQSGYVGTGSGDDIYNKTLTDANDKAKQQLVEAQESQEADIPNRTVNESILSIYRLLTDVVDGTKSLHVVGGLDMSFTPAGSTGGILS